MAELRQSAWLCAAVTGETYHVDAGCHTVGMKQEDAPDIGLA